MLFGEKEQAVYHYFLDHPGAEVGEKDFCAALGLTKGMLYRVLVRLEMRGHLEGKWSVVHRPAAYRMRRYRLTLAGREALRFWPGRVVLS